MLLPRTGREYVLREALDEVADSYDEILLDCAPSLGVLTINALTAADEVLIPLQCETLSHRGVGQLLDTVHDVQRLTNRGLRIRGVLPTLYDGRTNHARSVLADVATPLRPAGARPADPQVGALRRGAGGRPFGARDRRARAAGRRPTASMRRQPLVKNRAEAVPD